MKTFFVLGLFYVIRYSGSFSFFCFFFPASVTVDCLESPILKGTLLVLTLSSLSYGRTGGAAGTGLPKAFSSPGKFISRPRISSGVS